MTPFPVYGHSIGIQGVSGFQPTALFMISGELMNILTNEIHDFLETIAPAPINYEY